MTEGDISSTGRKNSYFCIYSPDILETYIRNQ